MEGLLFMLPPFAACLTLIGIHGYFGIHVLKRGIIFIDIAMAQIAALGGTFAFVLHLDHESPWTYPISFAFVMLAAFLFASIKARQPRVSMEAMIGVTYAVASTAALILIDQAAGSHEHIKEMLVGSILWVKWAEILESAAVYAIIGGLHYFFRDRLLPLSENYARASREPSSRWWDFLFYATLGIVVMHSVRIGGILVVFAFLIMPSAISALFSQRWLSRIVIGWSVGTVVSVLGLYLSWKLDVPSGPAVVVFLGLFLMIAAIGRRVRIPSVSR